MTVAPFEIRRLESNEPTIEALAHLLVATVASGGSVNFMHPMPLDDARAFWRGSLAGVDRDRIVFGAYDGATLAATVSLLLAMQPNQPHRADVGKMMTLPEYRGRGAARKIMGALEVAAHEHGRWLLTLDTAEEDGASGLYEKLGFTRIGVIPDYAYKPLGGLTGAVFYWKRLEPAGGG